MTILNDISPREYQQKIFETARNKNTLVVLPTGIGKTLISLMLAIERLKKYPSSKVLFLAPTRPLVEQHFAYFKKHLPELFAELCLFTGSVPAQQRKKLWQSAEIIFSTPQCVANDLKNMLYTTHEVSLLIIDEAHRCLKNYDYTKVVSSYKQQSLYPSILGLTASPGSDPDLVKQICKHLDIQEIELRTRSSEDVKPYLQELEFEKLEVPFPQEFIEIRVLLQRIWNTKVEQLRHRKLLFGPANKIILLKLQNSLARHLGTRNFNALQGMSLCAQAIKIAHALELLETQTLSGLYIYLQNLVQQAKVKKTKGVQTLVNSGEFQAALLSIENLKKQEIEHPKIKELSNLVKKEYEKNISSKIIIFTQFRDTASLILRHLSQIPNVRSSLFVGQAKKGDTGLSQKEQKAIIERFRKNELNTLIATSIAEEGLDIPEVNVVIFYEPIPSAIRKIQRAGRTARITPGKVIILITKDTRDEIHHYASSAREKKMHKTIHNIKEELKNSQKEKLKTLNEFK